MKFLKTFFKGKAGKIWLGVSLFLIVLMLVVTILANGIFYNLICLALGLRARPVFADGVVSMYVTENSQTREEANANANAMNIELCEEGFVLLKNQDSALPLSEGAKVSVFGKNSVNLSYGNSGSGGFSGVDYKTIYDSLEEAGFTTNRALKEFYEDDSRSGDEREANSSDLDSGGNQMIATAETPQSMYTSDIKSTYGEYSDAAIVVITRIGGEGFDLPRYQGDTEGAVSEDSHYLELDQNEIDLLEAVCAADFEHVIVVFNIPSAFEATFLTDTSYASFADDIDAALWIGFTGGEGIMALGEILNGEVNPSGRTVDTWSADFTQDPTFVNFGTGPTPDDSDQYDAGLYYFVDYEESIYVGYRYYETRGETDGEEWYDGAVVYPFGYGLSYTTFEWEIVSSTQTFEIDKDGTYTVEVKVTNTGNMAGKDVVQLYCAAPYYEGGIEKASRVLVGYAKTDEIDPGDFDTVTITFDPYSAASYDYRDANNNGFSGYELEHGDYKLLVAKNAHDVVGSIDCYVSSDICYNTDPDTGITVENRYTDREGVTDSDYQLSTILSRSNWEGTWPDVPTDEERAASSALIDEIRDVSHNNPNDYSEEEYPMFRASTTLTVRDLLPEETPEKTWSAIVDYDDERWDELLDACYEDTLIELFNYAAYQTVAVEEIGLPSTIHGDGPAGFTCFMNQNDFQGTCHYCSEPVMASTWNEELMQEFGEILGEEAIYGSTVNDTPYSAIYAPGVNIHRSMFGGRNAEYFSEDPLLTGKMAAAEIRGLQSMGVITMVKHFVANEQETHRSINGDCSWLTEQSLREIYLKSFEIAIKEGESRGVMTSFNRIGTKWTGGDYRLLTEILREEWGFRGAVICDFNTIPQYMNSRQMAYAGGDLNLATLPEDWCDSSDTSDAIVLRQAAKNILYTFVNSNALNTEVLYYKIPIWQIWLYVADGVVAAGIVAWGVGVGIGKWRKRES